jgi:4-hydroxymandelate oxidase
MSRSHALRGRREFVRLLAASPLAGALWSSLTALAQEPTAVIGSVDEALEVMDFEAVARDMLPAHWAYLESGVDDNATARQNHEAFSNYALRVRRLVDFSHLDTSVELFGTHYDSPIGLCPVGSLEAFHTQGESGAARAASAKGSIMMLSTQTSTGVEEVNEAYGEPVWYQLYARPDWASTQQLVRRVEQAGCPVLVFTIDMFAGRNTVTRYRGTPPDGLRTPLCAICHDGLTKPMSDGLAPISARPVPRGPLNAGAVYTWDYVRRLKDATSLPLVLKGILTREDAELAVEYGADGVMVSNHGGRGAESLRATVECLPEVVAGTAGRIPVLFDGGVRRGTDIFKALAMGADHVSVGRPYVWALAGFGDRGVEKVLELLDSELRLIMRQIGAPSIAAMREGRYVIDRRSGERL